MKCICSEVRSIAIDGRLSHLRMENFTNVLSASWSLEKKSITHSVIHQTAEIPIDGSWFTSEIVKCMGVLENAIFVVRGAICDNYTGNFVTYKLLLKESGRAPNNLVNVWNGKNVYLFHNSVYLWKNIRNNLLNIKQLLFPSFSCDFLPESVEVSGGSVSWKLLHEIHVVDRRVQAYLRAALKLTAQLLHPGNCK